MKRTIIITFVLLTFLSVILAINDVPPSFDFQQFYGSVTGLPAGTGFKVRAQIGTTQTETPIAANGQYGYSPTFKVQGQNGNTINFFIVNAQGAATAVGTPTPYQNGATTTLNFQYTTAPPSTSTTTPQPTYAAAICGNNIRESSEACDGTDLAGKTCASQVGTGSTGALNCTSSCTFNTTLCTAATGTCWECNEWSVCRNNNQTRNCVRYQPCSVQGPDVVMVDPATEKTCSSSTGTTPVSAPSSCLMSWECGAWSLCRTSQQSRICFRVDNCATLQAQNPAMTITPIPKPEEERSCQDTVAVPLSQQVCSPGMKRCLGSQLQLCSTEGTQWATFQTCPSSCDSISFECRTESAAPPQPLQNPSPSLWVYLLAGSIVLVLVIVSISISILNKKKYAPAKEYIRENRARGIDDEQIRERLVDEGWDGKAVGKLLR